MPDLHPVWNHVSEAGEVISDVDMRDVIRHLEELPINHVTLHKLSQAMNSCATLSTRAAENVKKDAVYFLQLENSITEVRKNPSTQDVLPMIKADVVEYSEEPLKQGKSLMAMKLLPLQEEQERVRVQICLALDFESWGLPGKCCSASRCMTTILRT